MIRIGRTTLDTSESVRGHLRENVFPDIRRLNEREKATDATTATAATTAAARAQPYWFRNFVGPDGGEDVAVAVVATAAAAVLFDPDRRVVVTHRCQPLSSLAPLHAPRFAGRHRERDGFIRHPVELWRCKNDELPFADRTSHPSATVTVVVAQPVLQPEPCGRFPAPAPSRAKVSADGPAGQRAKRRVRWASAGSGPRLLREQCDEQFESKETNIDSKRAPIVFKWH